MKKRLLALLVTLSLCLGVIPAAVAKTEAAIKWYPEAASIFRFYGTDRMLLEKRGYALYGLDGTQYTGYDFEVVDPFRSDGQAVACLKGTGKWGRIDMNGNTVAEFVYDTREEAGNACNAQFVSKYADGSAPYAVANLEGNLLTDYKYWQHGKFSYGYALVTDGGDGWAFVNDKGVEITEQKYNTTYDVKMGTDNFGPDGWTCVQAATGGYSYNIIDSQGKEVFAKSLFYKPWRAGHGLWGFAVGQRVGFYDTATRQVVIEPQYYYQLDPKGFRMGYRFDDSGQAVGYLTEGEGDDYHIVKTTIDLTELIEDAYHEGLRRVQDPDSSKWGFEDEGGDLVIPCIYDSVGYFDRGVASVRLDGVYGLLKNPLIAEPEHSDERLDFTDVPADAWFAPYVDYVAQKGIMIGRGDGVFGPNDTLTGQECLTLAVRLYDLQHGGSGALKEAPADWGLVTMTFSDGTVESGYADDWYLYAPMSPMGTTKARFCVTLDTEEKLAWAKELEGTPATLTLAGVDWKGKAAILNIPELHQVDIAGNVLRTDPERNYLYVDFYDGEGAYQGPTYDQLLAGSARRPGPGHWVRDAAYTADCYGLTDYPFPSMVTMTDPAEREMFARALSIAAGELEKINQVGNLPDLERDEENEYVFSLYDAGILTGTDDYGTFDAHKTLTRAECAAMVARVLDPALRVNKPLLPLPLREHTVTALELDGWFPVMMYAGVAADWMPVHRPRATPDPVLGGYDYAIYRSDGTILDLEGGMAYEGEYVGALGTTDYAVVRKFNQETSAWEYGVYHVSAGEFAAPYGTFQYVPQAREYIVGLEGDKKDSAALYERLGYDHYDPERVQIFEWDGLEVACAGGQYIDEATGLRAAETYDWVGPLNADGQGFACDGVTVYRLDFVSRADIDGQGLDI